MPRKKHGLGGKHNLSNYDPHFRDTTHGTNDVEMPSMHVTDVKDPMERVTCTLCGLSFTRHIGNTSTDCGEEDLLHQSFRGALKKIGGR